MRSAWEWSIFWLFKQVRLCDFWQLLGMLGRLFYSLSWSHLLSWFENSWVQNPFYQIPSNFCFRSATSTRRSCCTTTAAMERSRSRWSVTSSELSARTRRSRRSRSWSRSTEPMTEWPSKSSCRSFRLVAPTVHWCLIFSGHFLSLAKAWPLIAALDLYRTMNHSYGIRQECSEYVLCHACPQVVYQLKLSPAL